MYFPYLKGRYEVAPGLLSLEKDFGNGAWDQKLFQVGPDFETFRAQKLQNRRNEALSKYVCFSPSADFLAVGQIVEFMAQQLVREYPLEFKFQSGAEGFQFENTRTGEILQFHAKNDSVLVLRGEVQYENAWHAIGTQVPEDLAIWKLNADGSEEIEALHLNAPNHWAAEDKVGKSFAAVHQPVAHIEKIVPWAVQILEGIIEKGPYVRFAWGVGTDSRLNHHPKPSAGIPESLWAGRLFDEANPSLFIRVERQVLWGFPGLNRALFTIRTYFQNVEELACTHPLALRGLIDAIDSMTPQSLHYKGLSQNKDRVKHWLNSLLSEKK
ncbi:MAG: DUF3445 domain-containing protein [Bdellovibrionales bacterium]|nr:DUF3445 domain-containing protein [Oligoflexia bacterium]